MHNIRDYKVLIGKIPGIISSRFVTNEENEIIELHVLADTNRSPKQLVRDIQSAMLTTYDLRLDHKIISIAQIDGEDSIYKNHRLSLQQVKITSEGAKSQVEVILLRGGEAFTGIAEGGNSSANRVRLVSNATLNAVQYALGRSYTFILSDVVELLISGQKAFVLSVSHLNESGEELLCGCCLVTKDENEAVVKATLNAINRRITKYFS
ncbi:MAG: hypothetical protein GX352_07350 [Clostridiales bacterium]|nr:hypothetical protein [Clostridiales bacterium]